MSVHYQSEQNSLFPVKLSVFTVNTLPEDYTVP